MGFHISKELFVYLNFALLLDWGIDRKIFSITLDNASANEVLQKILREQLNLQK